MSRAATHRVDPHLKCHPFLGDVYGEAAKLSAALAREPLVTLGFESARQQVQAAL